MLRVKISLVYLLLLGLMIGAAVGLIHVGVGDLALSQTAATLQQAVVGAEQSAHLEEASLLARARFVADYDRLYRSLKGEFVTGGEKPEGEEDEAAPPVDIEGQRHIDADEKLKAQKFRLDDLIKAENVKPEHVRSVLARDPKELDIFMVVDEKGKGVAALGKDLYSWFGADVGKQHPEVLEVAKGGESRTAYWMWSFKPGEEKRLYRVAIAPVKGDDPKSGPAGVVVLGASINDGLAKRKHDKFAGEDATAGSTAHIAFYRGEDIVGSTFDTTQQKSVATALAAAALNGAEPTTITEISVGEEPHLAVSRPLGSAGGAPVGVAVLSSISAAQAPMTSLRVDVVLVGIVLLLLGIVLIVVVIHRYIKPVEDLEDGVQEIITGNKDYVFTQIGGHELQAGLAQQMNLMSAFLQGKPMPDDDSTGQSWGDLMPSGEQKPAGPGQVSGVDLAGLMGAKKNDDDGPAG